MGKTISKVYSAELEGIDARLIEVKVDLNVGLHSFNIVGLDRIDIQINVPRLKFGGLEKAPGSSTRLKDMVRRARETQANRFRKAGLKKLTNSELSSRECEELIILTEDAKV